MPTLVNIEIPATQSFVDGSNTARTTDMMWMQDEFLGENRDNMNDSTLSGSILAEALDDMKRGTTVKQRARHAADDGNSTLCSHTLDESRIEAALENSAIVNKYNQEDLNQTTGSHTLDGEDVDMNTSTEENRMDQTNGSRTLDESYFESQFSEKTPALKENKIPIVSRKERVKGPMEQRYEAEYSRFVHGRINAFRSRHPNKWLDYHTLSASEREGQQIRVLKLLQRLKITSTQGGNDESTIQESSFVHAQMESPSGSHLSSSPRDDTMVDGNPNDTVDETLGKSINFLSPGVDRSARSPSLDKSMALLTPGAPTTSVTFKTGGSDEEKLSPDESKADKSMALLTPNACKTAKHDDGDTEETDSHGSVEIARSAMPFNSPDAVQTDHHLLRKRMATSSGKRGADLSRIRKSCQEESCVSFRNLDGHETPLKQLESSMHSLSVHPQRVFTASQSPISPCDSDIAGRAVDMSSCSLSRTNVSFGCDDNDCRSTDGGMESVDDTQLQNRRVHWKFDECQTRDAPANVRVKKGEVPHYQPLDLHYNVKSSRAPPTQSFPDPLEGYIDRTRRRLERLCEWMRRRDEKASDGGLILSLQPKQVIDITVKLLLDRQYREKLHAPCEGFGQTLIVARSKEDLEEWGRAFLEGTAFSVLNHATLPLKERKTQSSALKCAQYDVVLTTFDAMKAPDSNVTVDAGGIVVKETNTQEDGWFNSRSSSAPDNQECKRLSVLHRLTWRRVILADVLGKKCYLAKLGTSRATAARALSSDSRFLFVTGVTDNSSLNTLIKSDRNSLESIASVLQIEEEPAEETLLQKAMADFNDGSSIR